MKCITLVLFSFIPFIAFSQNANTTLQMESEVKATLVSMWDAIEKEDMERYASFVHPDFTAFGETNTYLSEGKEMELRSVRNWLKTADNVHTEMHNPQVTIKGDVAWITYYWTDAGLDGGKPFSSQGKSTRIFVREKGKWLCIHGHYTLVP
jgi:ketosteroid isomerase-like protein